MTEHKKLQSSSIDRDQLRVRSVANLTENAQTMPELVHVSAGYMGSHKCYKVRSRPRAHSVVAGTTGPCQPVTSLHASFKLVVTAIEKGMYTSMPQALCRPSLR